MKYAYFSIDTADTMDTMPGSRVPPIEDHMFKLVHQWRNTLGFLDRLQIDLVLCLERALPDLGSASNPQHRNTSGRASTDEVQGLKESFALYIVDDSFFSNEHGTKTLRDTFGNVPQGIEEIVLIDVIPPSYCRMRGLPLGVLLRRDESDYAEMAIGLNAGKAGGDGVSPVSGPRLSPIEEESEVAADIQEAGPSDQHHTVRFADPLTEVTT